MKRSLWGWVLLCTLSVTLAFGQTASTSLRGTIKDPSGALVPGATITLTDNTTGKELSTTSGADGLYAFPQIPPAKYTISAVSAGFGSQKKTAELLVNQPATIDFALSVQTSSVTVDVSATAQTLNFTDASMGASAGNAEIQALPSLTRNVPDLLSLQPGVLFIGQDQSMNVGGDSRQGAVNGGRSDQGNVTVDGVDDNDQVNGFAFTGVLRQTQDSIEEFRVVTGGANADSGRSSGAQISMVTKSGTNAFHGGVYWYHRPTFTVANDWFNKQAEVANGQPNVPGKLLRNIFGVAVGGPIKKDKLFFFGNYEGQRQAENQQVIETVPTAAYQAGNLSYFDDSGNVQVLSNDQFAQLDAGCMVCNTTAYPNPPGPNPNALAFFQSMPAANGTAEGDTLNEGSYSFSSPHPISLNTMIGKLDFTPSDRHRLFVRGQLQKDITDDVEQFPGQGAADSFSANNKGIVAGDTWTITPNLINDIRYGFIRQGFSQSGVGQGDYTSFRFLSTPTAQTRSTITSIPVHNIVDNLSWIKGKHTIEVGGNWRLILQNHSSDAISYNSGSTNPYWLSGDPPDPADLVPALPTYSGGFANSYQIAFANMAGTVPSVTNNYNYAITSSTGGTALADGAFIDRHFKTNEFEWFVQDAWRLQPNLTITFGVRHTILQTPYETKGQQVTPTVDTHEWYLKRESEAQAGHIFEDDLQFSPAGKFYNKPGFWPMQKDNFAPRFAIAYSPDSKTSIRAGAGLYYDHYGQALVSTFDQNGSYGMSSSITNPAGVYRIEGNCATGCGHPGAPRFLDRHSLPNLGASGGSDTIAFPYAPPDTIDSGFAITWGLDSKIKTPYSEAFNLSLQRELPGGFMLETNYVGRLGRHLLQQLDLAEPVDYVDPQGGGDYFAAGTALSKASDANGGDPDATVSAIPYFENVFPWMANYDYDGESATQAIYSNEWAPYRYDWGATTSLSDLDFYCSAYYDQCPADWKPHFWQSQFSSLYALSSIGMSYYNAAQVTLRHPMSHGFMMDFSYTLSKSIDMGSDTERSTENGGFSSNSGSFSTIQNTWKPSLNRGPSDFDTRHLITSDWVYQLPVGRGKALAGGAGSVLNALIGGWQNSGIARWSSGLPFTLFEPGWTTNWEQEAYGVVTGDVKVRKHRDDNGNVQFFDDPDAINNGVYTGGPVRLPYPGEAGQRNNFRGDGFFNVDSGLDKAWKIRETGSIKFAWEVYNVFNTVRFDPYWIGAGLTDGSLGIASATLTTPRRMQFSLRYDF